MKTSSDLESIFFAALEKPSPAERAALLDEACAGDEELRARVEKMLAAQSDAGSFLEQPALEFSATVSHERLLTEGPGAVLGPYKLLQQIGEGGMGVVFMAEQTVPFQRTVALKIIKPGMDTRQVIARFEAERQAVAMMEHPNIAKVLDAGTTDSGRPYFVMELVKGVPITKYSDEKHLPIRERLELFVEVCQAVQHAHQKGIIHRDIKPNNVLVAEYDNQPAPKVIDFGVAKATAQKLTERTMFTEFGQMVGTVEYMSPEQAKLNQLDVDTRSDIYSLGVLLYELLTGSTPFEGKRLHEAAFDEMLRIIREEEPHKPSAYLTTLARQAASTVSAHRGSEPHRLRMAVRGELDWIVMKCLEKDRNRRYESASSLAADVIHHLNNEAVEACPPSARYRLGKFVRRYRVALTTAFAVLTTVVVGLATSAYLIAQERDMAREAARRESTAAERERGAAQVAERERQRAEANLRTAREAVDKLFTNVAEELTHQPHMEQIRRRLLQDALEFYQGFLQQRSDDPEMRHETARAYRRVGEIHGILGNDELSEAALRQSVDLLERLTNDFPATPAYREDLIRSLEPLAYRVFWAPRPEEVVELRRRALSEWERLVQDFPTVPRYQQGVANAHTNLGNALKDAVGRWPEAEKHHRLALTAWKKFSENFPKMPEDRVGMSHSRLWLGVLLLHTDRLSEAEPELRRALELREQLAAQAPADSGFKGDLAHNLSYLAELLRNTGRPAEAVPLYQRSIDIREKLRDDFPHNAEHQRRLGHEYSGLSGTLLDMGRTEEAEDAVRRALAIRQKLVDDHPESQTHRTDLAWSYYNLGQRLHDTGRPVEAAEAFGKARDMFEGLTKEVPDQGHPHFALAWMLATSPAQQFRNADRAIEAAQRALQREPLSRGYWQVLGIAQYRAGKWKPAVETLAKALELGQGGECREWFFLAMAHHQLGHNEEARNWYKQASEWMDQNKPRDQDLVQFRAEAELLLEINAMPEQSFEP